MNYEVIHLMKLGSCNWAMRTRFWFRTRVSHGNHICMIVLSLSSIQGIPSLWTRGIENSTLARSIHGENSALGRLELAHRFFSLFLDFLLHISFIYASDLLKMNSFRYHFHTLFIHEYKQIWSCVSVTHMYHLNM